MIADPLRKQTSLVATIAKAQTTATLDPATSGRPISVETQAVVL